MKCVYCDNEIPNGLSKCPSCGAAVPIDAASKSKLRPGLRLPQKREIKLPGRQPVRQAKQSHSAPPPADNTEWYYLKGEDSLGPFKTTVMKALISSGEITKSTFVWNEKLAEWVVACDSALENCFNVPSTGKAQSLMAAKRAVIASSTAEKLISKLTLDCGYIALTSKKLTGSVSMFVTQADGSKVESTKNLDILLNLITSTEIISVGAPTAVTKLFVFSMLVTVGLFYFNVSPWCLVGAVVTALFGALMVKKRYILKIAVAGNDMEIPVTSGDKDTVESFISAVRSAKVGYERNVGL